MKFYIVDEGDYEVGIPHYVEVVVIKIEKKNFNNMFYKKLEKNLKEVLKESYEELTGITVYTEKEYDLYESNAFFGEEGE